MAHSVIPDDDDDDQKVDQNRCQRERIATGTEAVVGKT
jgi:hypothetical protein